MDINIIFTSAGEMMKHGLKGLLFVFSVAACSTAESQKTVKHDANFEVGEAKPNQFWWPDKVNLSPLEAK